MVVQGKQRVLVVESWLAIALPIRRRHADGGIWYVVQYNFSSYTISSRCESWLGFHYKHPPSTFHHRHLLFLTFLIHLQAIPITALVIYIFCLLIWTGKTNPDATGDETLSEIFSLADAYTALMWGVSNWFLCALNSATKSKSLDLNSHCLLEPCRPWPELSQPFYCTFFKIIKMVK